MTHRLYKLKTDFSLDYDSDINKEKIFHKKLELLCLEYDVKLDWDYLDG